MSVALILAAVACWLRALGAKDPRLWLFCSSAFWTAVVLTYPAWAVLTPGYLCLIAAAVYYKTENVVLAVQRVFIPLMFGSLTTTAAVWASYRLLGGHGFFFEN